MIQCPDAPMHEQGVFSLGRISPMSTRKLADRVAALENEVARLRRDLEGERGEVKPWWESIAGTFAQDRLYKEAMRLGQQQRRDQKSFPSRQRRESHARARH